MKDTLTEQWIISLQREACQKEQLETSDMDLMKREEVLQSLFGTQMECTLPTQKETLEMVSPNT